jgi:hypothetical protein
MILYGVPGSRRGGSHYLLVVTEFVTAAWSGGSMILVSAGIKPERMLMSGDSCATDL